MKVFVLIAEYEDGTAGVKLYDGRVYTDELITELLNNSPAYCGLNEGYKVWEFPDDFDFEAAGMSLITRR